jgi:hypothetical protein
MRIQQDLYFSATGRRSSAPCMKTISVFGEGSKMEVSLVFARPVNLDNTVKFS